MDRGRRAWDQGGGCREVLGIELEWIWFHISWLSQGEWWCSVSKNNNNNNKSPMVHLNNRILNGFLDISDLVEIIGKKVDILSFFQMVEISHIIRYLCVLFILCIIWGNDHIVFILYKNAHPTLVSQKSFSTVIGLNTVNWGLGFILTLPFSSCFFVIKFCL